jgi:HK97 family phage prohead protease
MKKLMNQASSVVTLTEKRTSSTSEFFTVKGIATTPTPDRMKDVVEPMGAEYKLPIPLLWQHDHSKPVGRVINATKSSSGIAFEARITRKADSTILQERVDEAIASIQNGLVNSVSIGFRGLTGERMKAGGFRYKTWEWMELSLVTIPANADAVITQTKSVRPGVKLIDAPREPSRTHRKPVQLISGGHH